MPADQQAAPAEVKPFPQKPWFLRLLPLTILALALLLGQKCVLLAGVLLAAIPGTGNTVAGATLEGASMASAAAATPIPARAVPPVVNWDSTQPPPAVCPPATTLDPAEVAVLSALRQRAAVLDAREAALNRKQALIDVAVQKLNAQIAGLQAIEHHLNALSETERQVNETRWQALVATYEAMDPQAAAGIFDGLNADVLLPVLTRMNTRKSALILADMSPDKARQATELMAGEKSSIGLGLPAPIGQ